jgi:TRAP-type mannitol/chloroaromatic compound transport system permease large subunit
VAARRLTCIDPPAITLVVMAEILAMSAGALFAAAVMPGLLLSGLYLVYILIIALVKPQ